MNMEIDNIKEVALTKLVLWYDMARIQTIPELISEIPDDEALASPTEFGRRYLSSRNTDKKHTSSQDVINNLPGLLKKNQTLVLKGIGLLDKKDKKYVLSEAAIKLKNLYKNDKESNEWARFLAVILLTRDPRIRIFFKLLSEENSYLMFESAGWFGKKLCNAYIETAFGSRIFPFREENGEYPCLRGAIDMDAWWALGHWRTHDLLKGHDDCRYVGQFQENYSLYQIATAIKAVCELLVYLDILQFEDGCLWLDQTKAVEELGKDLAYDYEWISRKRRESSLIDMIADILPQLVSGTGFIIASELREKLVQKGISNPDKEIALLEDSGVLCVYVAEYGQCRHGEGLYGDPGKQLIKMRITI